MKYLVIERGETFLHSEETLREYLKTKPAGWTFRGGEGTDNGFPKSKVDYAVNLTETPLEKNTSVVLKIDGAVEVPLLVASSTQWRLPKDATVRRATKDDIGKRAFVYSTYASSPNSGDVVSLATGRTGRLITGVTTDGLFAVSGLESLHRYAWVLA